MIAGQHTPHYLNNDSEVDRFLASIGAAREIAVDTEGASFHRFVDRIYLLQLSTREASAILDPLTVDTPVALGALLESPHVEVVFHDADYDLRLLHQDYRWCVTNIFDTRVAAQVLGIRSYGLAALLEKYFGVRLDKKHQRADWSMRPLTRDMLDYAAQDTMFLLDLRDRMKSELIAAGRWSWAEEEFGRLEGTRWSDEADDGGAFLRIKGARDLTRRELALFRELVNWRDGVARELDRATFRVAGNEALMDVARAAPRTIEALSTIRGMPRSMVERRGSEVLDAVRRGVAVPDEDLPRFPKAQRWERDADFDANVGKLRAVRDTVALRLGLDAGVLCSRERLEAIARIKPRNVEDLDKIEGLRRWQISVLAEELIAALR